MSKLLQRAIMPILGLLVCLGWWSLRGDRGGSAAVSGIPEKVWAGGAGTMAIEVETSGPARLNITFSEEGDTGKERSIECWERLAPGPHVWQIDLPANAGGYVDLTAEEPAVGAQLRWVVRINDRIVAEETQTLDAPLEPNYAFGLQLYMDDYSTPLVD